VDHLQRQLAKEKDRTADLVQAVRSAVVESAAGLIIPPVPRPPRQRKRGEPEKALVTLSDLQLGKVTATYNTEVAEARVYAYARKVIKLAQIQQADHPVREARVYMLGDMIEGELIFPNQPFQIDSSIFRQVCVDGPRILTQFLRILLTSFDKVHVVCVIGNHGRTGSRHQVVNPETNYDRMLYENVRGQLKNEKRITWNIPFEQNDRAWYAVDYPFGGYYGGDSEVNAAHPHGFLLFHGDQVSNSAAASTKAIATRVWGWASGAVPEPFCYAIWGHWHSPKRIQLNNIVAWCNGSVESTNTFAQERLSAMGKPEQLLLFCHPRVGVSAEYWIQL
jgi:hypothetical protein